MKYFNCDYNEGAHERILQKLAETNMEQTPGYGEDIYCLEAAKKIREICQSPDVDVHFMVGGTQTNLTVITAALRPYQGVISADSGHINTHESGAIENCGHKILTIASEDGKVSADQIKEVYQNHIQDVNHEHTVQPGMVYISNPTELGTTYSKKELESIHTVCKESKLYLYMDGARLGYALAAAGNTLDFPSIVACCDAFYIGGTKVGAMFGEALVIVNELLKKDFRYMIKQKGTLLAKGRLLGIQFYELFSDGLYERLGRHGNQMAELIREGCEKSGYPFLMENNTNQVFPILPDHKVEELKAKYSFLYQCRVDESHSAIRFCTSWATKKEDVLELIKDLAK